MRNHEYDPVALGAIELRAWRIAATRRRAGIAAAGMLTAASIALSAASAPAQPGPFQLAPGGRSIISLSENPTTGYVWRFDPQGSTNAGIVNVTDLGFARPQSAQPTVGAPGLHRWSVEAVRAGSARLHFINSRPWEGTPAQQQTIAVEVR